MKSPKLTYAITLTAALLIPALVVPSISFADDNTPAVGQKAHGKHKDRLEAGLARLKAELKITEKQESAWQGYAHAIKEQRTAFWQERKEMRAEKSNLTAPERMDHRLEFHKKQEVYLEKTSVALKKLYHELTPEQREIFNKAEQAHEKRMADKMREMREMKKNQE